MRDPDVEVPVGTILYELICTAEWKDEREEQVLSLLPTKHPAGILSYVNPTKFFKKKSLSVPESVKWLKGLGPLWQISITPDGNIIGLLQNSVLETRSAKDNFNSTFGRSPVMKDPNPNFRLMAWSRDSSLLAVSFSNGQIIIYDTMASQLCSVRRCALPSQEGVPADVFSAENALAGLIFTSERVKNCTHANELISVDTKGFIKCFRQTNADQMTFHHDASVRRYYPKGIYSAAHIESHGLLLVSGALEVDSSSNSQEPSLKYGITIWRLINDEPYYRIVFNVAHDEFRMDSKWRWKIAVSSLFPNSAQFQDAIFKVVVSPNEKYSAALHTSGTISIWHLPSLKLFRSWPLKTQHHHWTENTRFNNRWRVAFNRWHEETIDDWRFHPFDVNWWNDNILIISRVNGCISLCATVEEVPTKNLLGDSPETLESPAPILRRQGKGFFALECELRLKVEDRRNSNGDLIQNSEINSLELLDEYDSQFLPKTLIQEVLFWMTDIEKFRPPRKRKRKPPVWKETHRLFLLRNITPLELFHQKIEAEEYGEALDLARAYKLDADLVYQRQWSKAPVSVHTIRDYLGKIKKRNWVLQECLERVPDNVDAARELLQFGLQGTDLSAAVMISQGKDNGQFNLLTADDLDISQEEYMLLVDSDNLEVKRLLSFRKQFLFYLDILDTYELMIGGFRMVDDNFDGALYGMLRRRSPAESAIEMARSSDISALRIMLTHHWFEIAPQYLTVLSSFPETTCPHDYSDFLPVIDQDGEVLLWDEVVPKDRDWCESFLETGVKLRRASAGSMVADISQEQVTIWYEERIREVERFSGITSFALDLARLGVQRNIPGLQSVLEDLEVVEVLVYDAKVDVTLDTLEELSPLERLQLLMSNANTDVFVRYLRELVFPFLEKCEAQEKGMRFHLLDQYLTSLSIQDLSVPRQIFEHSKSGLGESQIITDVTEIMRLAYNCIYACKNTKQTDNIMAILGCLPERNRGVQNDSLKELHEAIDELELHYQSLQILDKYDIPIPLQELKDLAVDEEMDHRVLGFFQRICDTARWTKPQYKVNEWKAMLYDLLNLQKKVFKNFPMDRCFELYVVSLLRSGSADVINLARDFFDRNQPEEETQQIKDEVKPDGSIKTLVRRFSSAYSTAFAMYLYLIPYDKSLEMILIAAQHYFDSASNYSDPDIELCKVCLNLIHNPKESSVSQMFDLIDAIKIINKDFQVNILPQTVRLTRDKLALVRQAMENIPDGYRKTQQLLKLSLFLQLEDLTFPETESLIFDMAGNTALIEFDMKFCVQICQNIIAKRYQTGWRVFTQVAKYQSDPPVVDHETRLVFINYALNMCPDDEILNVLNSKYLIEIRSLQSRIAELSPESSALDESLLDVPESDISVQDSLNPVKFQEFLSTTSRWINPLKDMAHVVSTGSGALLKTAKIAALANPLLSDFSSRNQSSTTCTTIDENELNSNFVQEAYPALYLEKEEKNSRYFHESQLAFKYNTFSSSSSSYAAGNPALELCITLNRIWHLERSLLGNIECGRRDDTVIEQLVQEILSEDLPWGMAILLSIENVDTLSSILSRIPLTPVSLTVILYYISISIHKHTGDFYEASIKDANQVIQEVEEYVQHHFQFIEKNYEVEKLLELYNKFKDQLTTFKTSRGYVEMELDLLGKSNRDKVSRMKNLVNLAFLSEKVDDIDLVHSAGRKDLLTRLIATASTFEEYSCVIEILRTAWIDEFSSSAKKNEWVQLLCTMVRSEEGIVHEEIIAVLKQLEEEGKMLDKNCFFYIMGEAKRNKANMLFSRLGFLSKDPKLQIEAAKMVKRSDFEVEDLDEEVLYQLIRRGFITSFVQKKEFFDGLIQAVVERQTDKNRNWPGIDTIAEQLKNAGHETEAQELLSKHGGLIPGLQVFKSALNIGSWGKWGKGSGGE